MKQKIGLVMKGTVLNAIVLLVLTSDSWGQYTTAVGVRIGGTTGVAAKYFYKPGTATEGILGSFGNGASLTGLVERYEPVYNAAGFYVFYGGGLHLAFYNGEGRRNSYFGREIDYRKNNDVGFGINGIVGVEYKLPNDIPIIFSLDLKPFVEIGSGGYASVAPDPSVGMKVILK